MAKKKSTWESRFYQLKNHISSMVTVQDSNLARLAMNNPKNLEGNGEFRSCVIKHDLLDSLLNTIEVIETS